MNYLYTYEGVVGDKGKVYNLNIYQSEWIMNGYDYYEQRSFITEYKVHAYDNFADITTDPFYVHSDI